MRDERRRSWLKLGGYDDWLEPEGRERVNVEVVLTTDALRAVVSKGSRSVGETGENPLDLMGEACGGGTGEITWRPRGVCDPRRG